MTTTTPRIVKRIDLTIIAPPEGKGRPRFRRATGTTYTPEKTVSAEQAARHAWHEAGGHRLPDRTPIMASITCTLQRPPSHFTTKGELSAAGRNAGAILPLKKPDVDNAAKLVLDALEGYAYAADVCIATLHVYKVWGPVAQTTVSLIADDLNNFANATR